MNIKKTIIGIVGLSAIISSYVIFVGQSAISLTTSTSMAFAQSAIASWKQITLKTGLDIGNTEKGFLQPLIPANFSALDLVVYGSEIVDSKYRESFEEFKIPRLVGSVHISNNEDDSIKYSAGGLIVQSINNLPGSTHGVVYFNSVPKYLAEGIDLEVDGVVNAGDGSVRYTLVGGGYYVLGMFLPYPE